MTDIELSVHFEQLDPTRERRCSCTSKWKHKYFHCEGVIFPDFETEDFQCYAALERRRTLETAFRDHVEILCSLGQGTYWDLYEALHQDKNTFVNFLDQEPYRLEHYWSSDLAEGNNAHILTLANKFLGMSNLGRIIVGRLLRPDIFYQVFRESITPQESDIMLRSKNKFMKMWNNCVNHVSYGDFPVYTNTSRDPSGIMPERPSYTYVWDDSGTTVAEEVTDDGRGSQEDRQEWFDSAVGLEDNDSTLDGADEELEHVPVINGHAHGDMEETSADVPVVNGNQHEDQSNGTLDESSVVASGSILTTNGHHGEEETNHTQGEDNVLYNAETEDIPTVNGLHSDEDHPTTDDNQDISSLPTENTEGADEQSVDTLEALSDDTYEISEQHPEIVAALQMIVALGNSIQAQNWQGANGS